MERTQHNVSADPAGTSPFPRPRAPLALAAAVLLLAGCATLTPAQQDKLADYKLFAHRVTQAYGKPDIQIMVGDSNAYGDGVSLMRPDGWMILSPTVLTPVTGRYAGFAYSRDFAFAHELGHYVTNRFGCGPNCESAVNVEAVKILTVGRPDFWTSEQRAFNHSVSFIWSLKELQDKGRPVVKGHWTACQEIADLVAHYPAYGGKTC